MILSFMRVSVMCTLQAVANIPNMLFIFQKRFKTHGQKHECQTQLLKQNHLLTTLSKLTKLNLLVSLH